MCIIFNEFARTIIIATISFFIGRFFNWNHFKRTTRSNILMSAKNAIITEKVVLIGLLTGESGQSNPSNIEMAIEKIKSSLDETSIKSIREAWSVYYGAECNHNPDKLDRAAAAGALDVMIKTIDEKL